MERSELFDLMDELQLYGMKAAFDEIMATAVKRQHEPQRVIADLLTAEINEKQARSIKYQLSIAKLPLAKDLDGFQFDGTPINETLVRDLAGGGFLDQQRNAVLIGGTGTGKTHLAIAITRSCIRSGSRRHHFCSAHLNPGEITIMSVAVSKNLMAEMKLLGMLGTFDQVVADATRDQIGYTELLDALLQAEADYYHDRVALLRLRGEP